MNASELNTAAEYLTAGGWLEDRFGYWHPPSCLAGWPIEEAYHHAKRSEKEGRRLSPEEVKDYLEGR